MHFEPKYRLIGVEGEIRPTEEKFVVGACFIPRGGSTPAQQTNQPSKPKIATKK
ncbi:MAG: hypothetical protein ACREHD_24725 [Pirellulales bacterium]